ncbi:molybdopterin-dependent oxidoreductase [Hydrogenophaga sp. OTU3427]|uniref:molybdopterin-dependent oxidoreductase n=1 Tax=Hydrogenophaga sp. OTU3427 TaxID=3043856 RepID=UPI00313C58AA
MPLLSRRTKMALLVAGLLGTFIGAAPAAWALDAPKGKVVLTVKGKIGASNRGGTAVFDLAMLQALPQKTFTTMTPWEKAPVKFSGPLLRDVLAAVQAQGNTLKAVALNDYKINIPLEDTRQFDMVLAHRMNDQPIPVRTKGPLFIVYPFDSNPALQNAVYYERAIWQLGALEIE